MNYLYSHVVLQSDSDFQYPTCIILKNVRVPLGIFNCLYQLGCISTTNGTCENGVGLSSVLLYSYLKLFLSGLPAASIEKNYTLCVNKDFQICYHAASHVNILFLKLVIHSGI